MATLSEKIAALRNQHKVDIEQSLKQIQPVAEPIEPIELFPLYDFIWLYYTAAKKDVYINNFEGAKLLADWLGPLAPLEVDELELLNHNIAANYCASYEMRELAKILNTTPGIILWILMN